MTGDGRAGPSEAPQLEERIAALEREIARLTTPAQGLWSQRDLVWAQLERALRFGTWTWDVATQSVDWSPGLFAVLGYDPAQTPVEDAAREFDERVHPDDLDVYLEGQERALGGELDQRTRFRFVRPDGRTIHLLLLYTAVCDEAGKPTGFAGSIVDVSDRVEAEHDLLRAGRLEAIGRLAGSVAHDFNNLLMVVLGNAELLRLKDPENEHVREIQGAVQAGASLTGQLLSFTKHARRATVTAPLDDLVRDAVPFLKRLVREDILIRAELAAAEGRVSVDPGQFQAALVNLAVNAKDAMPDGGELILRTRIDRFSPQDGDPPWDAAVLRVEDTGVGMEPETQAKIFEPFFSTKDGKQGRTGTGLGLSSVLSFVRGVGGDLRVESSVGSGTVFEVFFLRVTAPPAPIPAADGSADAVPSAPEGCEVLVVEDADGIRRVLEASLKRTDYTPHIFASPRDALAAWPKLADRICALITDVVMPGQSGYELTARLREDRPNLGVVFVTGYDPDGTLPERSVVLGKPFTRDQLLDALARVRS